MKNKHLKLIVLLLFSLLVTHVCYANKDVELLRKRFTTELIQPAINKEHIQVLINTLQDDGTWPGINYVDTSNIGFQHRIHLDNMLDLSRAYKKQGTPYKGKKQVKQAFNAAMNYWLANDFICENWWHNQIGTPNTMVAILLIMDKDLTKEQIQKILPIAGRGHIDAWGARPSGDRIKIAGIQAKNALFNRDVELFERLIAIIEGEIKFSEPTERGMQYDYSFHHRDDRVNNTLSYGLGYADAFAEWAVNVADTRYRFSNDSMQHLIDYYLDGICKQMVFGRSEDTGIKNRDITRPQRRNLAGTTTPERLVKATDYRKEELINIIKARKGEDFPVPSYAKFFWQTEHFVFQRPRFYTSVRMYSTRNDNMEVPYNGEGLANHYRGDGTNYISIQGDEYINLSPVYDWMRIPGATTMISREMPSETEIQKHGLTGFVGGVTDGQYGATVFDFKSPHNPLSARKSWFFFDKEYVCLGAGITSETNREVVTTLNQCHLLGDVLVKSGTNIEKLTNGDHLLKEVDWIYHNNIGYIFPQNQDVCLMNDIASGSWFKVNRQTTSSKTEVKEDVFKLWLNHGSRVKNSNYEYIVMPGAGIDEVKSYVEHPVIEIISNTPELQAVKHESLQLAYAVFYRAGEVKISEHLTIAMDSPGMLFVKYAEDGKKVLNISVSDPSRTLGKIHLTVNHPNIGDRAIDLPQSVYAGKSVSITL